MIYFFYLKDKVILDELFVRISFIYYIIYDYLLFVVNINNVIFNDDLEVYEFVFS